jgi:hypothetical protein
VTICLSPPECPVLPANATQADITAAQRRAEKSVTVRGGCDLAVDAGDGWLAVEAALGRLDDSPIIAAREKAEAEAVNIRAAIDAEVEAAIKKLPEFNIEQDAAKALSTARVEAEKVTARHVAARGKYDSAIEEGRDPRPHRDALSVATTANEDVEAWVASLARSHVKAAAALAAQRKRIAADLWRTRSTALRADLERRRADLRTRTEAVLGELACELTAIDTLSESLRS